MSIQLNTVNEKNSAFQLKGGLYTLTSLQLFSTDLPLILQFLDSKIKQAPKFFQNAPVVIDLQKINQSHTSMDFKQLKEILQNKQLIPVGVKGGNSDQHAAAILAGFAILPEGNKETVDDKGEMPGRSGQGDLNASTSRDLLHNDSPIKGSNTKVITEPVRSGQQFYARGGDLIVLAPVSHGSELLADGHIHVYGPLRGRALAGVTGDTSAHIFCQSLEAELISIAGHYKISEDIDQSNWRLSVDVSLDEGRLHIQPL